eukprot:4156855-Pyramimonas_sp.AAC.1
MKWVEGNPEGPLYELLAESHGTSRARPATRWGREDDHGLPEWAREEEGPDGQTVGSYNSNAGNENWQQSSNRNGFHRTVLNYLTRGH